MRLSELIPANQQYQERREQQLNALVEHIPDYDYSYLSFDFGKLYISIRHSQLYEVAAAFVLMGWTGEAKDSYGNCQLDLMKKGEGKLPMQVHISTNTFADDKELLKDFHDRIKFG